MITRQNIARQGYTSRATCAARFVVENAGDDTFIVRRVKRSSGKTNVTYKIGNFSDVRGWLAAFTVEDSRRYEL